VQLDSGLKILGRLALATHAHVAGRDTFDGARLVVQHFSRRETWKNFDAK
jgi:hypothetical protein